MTKAVLLSTKRWPLLVDDGHLAAGRRERKANRIEQAVNASWTAKKRLFVNTSRKSLPYWQEILVPG